ncbi:GATOR complex protein WDR59-like isoform X2 [Branchiostoma floridae]|uniref:GATOR complex protein WDR59-like isoform X2 n=1 Tax=Branchiostoma floridae TaxID=7739 RepID=A0A9J7L9V3_BRAFL|nr:GATOR complex protein WDR59-like isoform X2 [Branchiostoma floridae]
MVTFCGSFSKMAARWSSENVVAEYRDLQATAMAVDCTGSHALLAGRKHFALVKLDNQQPELQKKSVRQSKWEVSAVQWCPHASNGDFFVAASNQTAEVYSFQDSQLKTRSVLKGHTRVISDVDWSMSDANTMATCSVDTYIYLWDIRDPRKPSLAYNAVAGASQVKWNKVNSYLLATTHEGDIRVWDQRKGSTPVQYIAAHLSKVHGLDWDPTSEHLMASSSQDCTVKFWDVTNPKRATSMLKSGAPVWRARYTPFGHGLITVMVPQLRRGENSLLLWNTDNLTSPIHTFVGHTDVVLEFQWRKQNEDNADYQLVTWSKDQSLRIWKIDPQLQRLCGHTDLQDSTEMETDSMSETSSTRNSIIEQIMGGVTSDSLDSPQKSKDDLMGQPETLQQEFLLVNIPIPNIQISDTDMIKRCCTVYAVCGNHEVKVVVTFPPQYPNNAAPSFQFIRPTSITDALQTTLLKNLRETSLQYVRRNHGCLDACIRQMVNTLDNIPLTEDSSPVRQTPFPLQSMESLVNPPLMSIPTYGTYQDLNVPFPRTSGARFCGVDKLVYFTRPIALRQSTCTAEPYKLVYFTRPSTIRQSSITTEQTPRSLSALSAYMGLHPMNMMKSSSQSSISRIYAGESVPVAPLSNFYFKEKKSRRSGKNRERDLNVSSKVPHAGPVLIQDVSCLLPVHQKLAETYILDPNNIPSMCTRNAAAANQVGRKDLVQVWSLAVLALSADLAPSSSPDLECPWAQHPFGRRLLQTLLEHYSKLCDVQTLAMLCCAYGAPTVHPEGRGLLKSSSNSSFQSNSSSGNMYGSPGTYDTDTFVTSGWTIGTRESGGMRRSVSWTETSSPDDYQYREYVDPRERERELHDSEKQLLDPGCTLLYDEFKKAYGEILYRWGLKDKRADVLKYMSVPPEAHKGIEFGTKCVHCHKDVRGPQCASCRGYGFQCAICHIAVKGSSNFCLACGHGGHSRHMQEWFQNYDICPTGCGCNCPEENQVLESL